MEPEKQQLVDRLVDEIRQIPNVAAIALGGSYAQGTQHANSDIDLGLYYREGAPFSTEAIRALAAKLNDRPAPVVTGFYEWGPWVNGGAWLTIGGQRVDFLYRNVDQLRRVVDECLAGRSVLDYEQQPPFGFYSHIYLGELHICRLFWDPQGMVAQLKAQIAVYPRALKKSLIAKFLWSAEFSLLFADKSAQRGDAYSTAGCLTRAAAYLTQVYFALNEAYFVTDKGALDAIEAFPLCPEGYAAALAGILSCPGSNATQLTESVRRFRRVVEQTVSLCGEWYKPMY